eukprot:TRINITY_DN10147_c0_g1_i1.p1 TRINITY_DN10147_c0_g1~~TRINITY_DN10147_c0_g1_i1.p1  ORF type:complete len:528 (+),score=85.00 TRINITY_DN10147_c0_g1_i1:207-1586(+)
MGAVFSGRTPPPPPSVPPPAAPPRTRPAPPTGPPPASLPRVDANASNKATNSEAASDLPPPPKHKPPAPGTADSTAGKDATGSRTTSPTNVPGGSGSRSTSPLNTPAMSSLPAASRMSFGGLTTRQTYKAPPPLQISSVSITKTEEHRGGKLNQSYTVYVIQVVPQTGDSWLVGRRFKQFHSLYDKLKTNGITVTTPSFSGQRVPFKMPAKKLIGSSSAAVIQGRRLRLEQFLREVVKMPEAMEFLLVQWFLRLTDQDEDLAGAGGASSSSSEDDQPAKRKVAEPTPSPSATPAASGAASVATQPPEPEPSKPQDALQTSEPIISPRKPTEPRRKCVALFEYTAADDTELSFAEGAELEILERKGDWVLGALSAFDGPERMGWLPVSFIKEIDTILFRGIALFDFTAEAEGELSFKRGDIVQVYETDAGDTWWRGRREVDILGNAKQGWFPSRFLSRKI